MQQANRQSTIDRLRSDLAPYADDLAEAAVTDDDPAAADAYACLAAIVNGEQVPERAASRIKRRAGVQ